MRLSIVLLGVAATLLSCCNAFDRNNRNRLLRAQETTNTANTNELNDEERAWGLKTILAKLNKNDFAKTDLDRMLEDVEFKREMFEKWNTYSTEKILRALDPEKSRNIPYSNMLVEYLKYRLREGAIALRDKNDFAKTVLDLMLGDVEFKREMFQKWNTYSTEKILTALNPGKWRNNEYSKMLEEYLNTYRLREGAIALRDGN